MKNHVWRPFFSSFSHFVFDFEELIDLGTRLRIFRTILGECSFGKLNFARESGRYDKDNDRFFADILGPNRAIKDFF